MSKTKGLVRSYVWWPGMDKNIEKEVQLCEECQKHHKSPPTAPLHPWEWPESPWSRIHVDYAGPFLGEMFLFIVDAHSKWMDIYLVKSTTTHNNIEELQQSFNVFGWSCWCQTTEHVSRVLNLRHLWNKMVLIYQISTFPPILQWSGREGGADFQGGDEEDKRGHSTNQTVPISVQLSNHAACNNRLVTCRTDDVTGGSISFWLANAWRENKSAANTTKTERESWHKEKTEKIRTRGQCVHQKLLIRSKVDPSGCCELIRSSVIHRYHRKWSNHKATCGSG